MNNYFALYQIYVKFRAQGYISLCFTIPYDTDDKLALRF